MNPTNWKSSRTQRPLALTIAEECLVNYLWYKTKIRNLFRKNLLNVGSQELDSATLNNNILKYGINRFQFFEKYFNSSENKPKKILEIGPGGLLIQGILFSSKGYEYSAIDAFQGKVFSPAAKKHYEHLRKNWDQFGPAPTQKKYLFPNLEELNYYVTPIEKVQCQEIKGPFDAIFSYGVFEHLYHPESAIKKCRELLSPRGQMVHHIDFFPHDFWSDYENPLEFLTVPKFWYEKMYNGRGAPNRYRLNWFKDCFSRAGFTTRIENASRYENIRITEIRPRVDKSVQISSDDDLMTSSATFICKPS